MQPVLAINKIPNSVDRGLLHDKAFREIEDLVKFDTEPADTS